MENQVTVHTFSRVASYSFVASAWGVANQYYSNLKKSEHTVVRGALETAERLAVPALATVTQVPTYCPTVVQRLDSIAMSQLDKAEVLVARSSQYVESTKVKATEIVGQSTEYIQSTTVSLREKGTERMNRLIQPIASATVTVVETPRTYVTAFFQKKEVNKSEGEEVPKQERLSYLAPIFRFTENITTNYLVAPFRGVVENVQNNEQVRRVSSSLDQRRKFAMEMFRATKATGEKKIAQMKETAETSVKIPVQAISNYKDCSRQLVSHYAVKGLSLQKSALGYVRNAVQYIEKQQTDDISPTETNYANYVPPFLFRYSLMTIDVSDLLLTRAQNYLETISEVPQPIPAPYEEENVGIPNGKPDSHDDKPFHVVDSDDYDSNDDVHEHENGGWNE